MIGYKNIVGLLQAASEGKALQVISTQQRWDGLYVEPAKDRFFADDIISDKIVHGTIKSGADINAAAAYAKSISTLMELATNVTPYVRGGQILGWDLDNNQGKIKIDPAKAKEALSNISVILH